MARRADVGEQPISAPLVLAVEVLSPGTRSVDLLLKSGVYAEGDEVLEQAEPFGVQVVPSRLLDG